MCAGGGGDLPCPHLFLALPASQPSFWGSASVCGCWKTLDPDAEGWGLCRSSRHAGSHPLQSQTFPASASSVCGGHRTPHWISVTGGLGWMIPGQARGSKAARAPPGLDPLELLPLGKAMATLQGRAPERPALERPAWTHQPCSLTPLEVLEMWQGVRWAGRGLCPLLTRLVLWHVWEDPGQPRLGC